MENVLYMYNKFSIKVCYKLTVKNMAITRIFARISDKFNVNKIYI